MPDISRRDFFKMFSLGATGKKTPSADPAEMAPAEINAGVFSDSQTGPLLTGKARETASVCTFCGCGCGLIVASVGDRVVHLEGDPDNPNNQGSLYCQGLSFGDADQIVDYDSLRTKLAQNRIAEIRYRAPGGDKWETKDWDWALDRIADQVKKVRDETFTFQDENGATVCRTSTIACLGGAPADNEENYLIQKMMRALGVINLDYGAGAGLYPEGEEPALAFERSFLTNGFPDCRNSDVFLLIGAGSPENHAQLTRFIDLAVQNRKAKVIALDQRDPETVAKADLAAALQPEADLPFIYGLINYALNHDLYLRDYVVNYTNAPFLVDPEENIAEGAFSGLTEKNGDHTYVTSTWQYQKSGEAILKDPTLNDPDCVFQRLKKHMSPYGLAEVAALTGLPAETFRQICELYCTTGQPGRAGNLIYARGNNQHTYGSPNLQAAAILQRLLGNIGVAGGGVYAPQRESNVQGAADAGMSYRSLPGYINAATASTHRDLKEYLARETPTNGYWFHKPKFLVSMLKAWYGSKATTANDFCFAYLPKLDGRDHSSPAIFQAMQDGRIKGFFTWGQNPAANEPLAQTVLTALEQLDWLIAVDRTDTETAAFWRRPGANPAEIKTEVFLLPAAYAYEKEGSATNHSRWMQWRDQAVKPPGQARSNLFIADALMRRIREKYAGGGVFPEPILDLVWNYNGNDHEPDIEKVVQEINGYAVSAGDWLTSSASLKDDGSTACGVWIYCGYYAEDPGIASAHMSAAQPG